MDLSRSAYPVSTDSPIAISTQHQLVSRAATGRTPVRLLIFSLCLGCLLRLSSPVCAQATHLAFQVQPSTTPAGQIITPAVVVQALTATNTVDGTYNAPITITIAQGPAGAVLSGTSPRLAAAGVATFNDLSLNRGGNTYILQATSGTLFPANSSVFTIGGVGNTIVSVGLAGNAVSLISLPDAPGGFDPFAGVVPLLDSNRNSALARWNPLKSNDPTFSKYEFLIFGGTRADVSFGVIETGRGYWRKGSGVFAGSFVNRTTTFDLSVSAGSSPFENWNLIGVPFTSSVDLSSLQVITGGVVTRTFGEAVAAGIVSDFVWTYPVFDGAKVTSQGYQLVSTTFANATRTLDPGRGYWMALTQDSTLRYNPPGVAAAQRVLNSRVAQSSSGWVAQVRARTGVYSDDYNFFGTSKNPRLLLKPPQAPEGGYVALTFVGSGARSNAVNPVRPAAALRNSDPRAPNEWEFAVETNSRDDVELSWPDLGNAPKELAIYLQDLESGRRLYMRTQSAYSFRASSGLPRHFRITAEPRASSNLIVRDLSVLSSQARSSTLTFVLNQTADVEVRVISPSGKVVSQRQLSGSHVGLNSVSLSHTDARGYTLPRGLYLCEVTATTPEGQTVKSLKGFATK